MGNAALKQEPPATDEPKAGLEAVSAPERLECWPFLSSLYLGATCIAIAGAYCGLVTAVYFMSRGNWLEAVLSVEVSFVPAFVLWLGSWALVGRKLWMSVELSNDAFLLKGRAEAVELRWSDVRDVRFVWLGLVSGYLCVTTTDGRIFKIPGRLHGLSFLAKSLTRAARLEDRAARAVEAKASICEARWSRVQSEIFRFRRHAQKYLSLPLIGAVLVPLAIKFYLDPAALKSLVRSPAVFTIRPLAIGALIALSIDLALRLATELVVRTSEALSATEQRSLTKVAPLVRDVVFYLATISVYAWLIARFMLAI